MPRQRRRLLAVLPVLALLSACGGDAAPTLAPTTTDENTAAQSPESTIEIDEGDVVPIVRLSVEADSESGHNVFIDVDDFELAPERVGSDPVDGEGHLVLSVDGERRHRLYVPAVHLGDLAPGEHEITVDVVANDHSPYAVGGEPIRATQTITVDPPSDGGDHHHPEPREVVGETPKIGARIVADSETGWNLFVDLAGHAIEPRATGSAPVDGQGHLHLFIDEHKVGRLYGTSWHIAELPVGTHEIRVEVSANDHATLTSDGEPISSSVSVVVGPEDPGAVDETEVVPERAGVEQVIMATVGRGEVTVDEERHEIPLDTRVAIVVEADVSDEVHLHGYDLHGDVAVGSPGRIEFVADVPGLFEVELEESGTFLFEILVR